MRVRRACAVLLLVAGSVAAGCGGSDEPSTAPPPAEPAAETTASTPEQAGPESAVTTEAELEAGLPSDVAGYVSWTLLNAAPIPPREDGDAHLGTKNVYASETAGADGVYPDGAIIVKEATRPEADFIGLVAVMRKVAGSDPEHNDWEFVEYTRESAGEPFTEVASGELCWSCHMGAASADYVWIAELGLTG